jgi:hypothetical protein
MSDSVTPSAWADRIAAPRGPADCADRSACSVPSPGLQAQRRLAPPLQYEAVPSRLRTRFPHGRNFRATIRSQNSWIPVTTTSFIVLTPTADPSGRIAGTGRYDSPRGCVGDFVTTGNATMNAIEPTFDGIDCADGSGIRLPFRRSGAAHEVAPGNEEHCPFRHFREWACRGRTVHGPDYFFGCCWTGAGAAGPFTPLNTEPGPRWP